MSHIAAHPKKPAYPCKTCNGEGRRLASRNGGNDPDVWDAGPCEQCGGSGNQLCEYCGQDDATESVSDSRQTDLICSACRDEVWEDEMP
jgi:DnaJ-class molecular chaperone